MELTYVKGKFGHIPPICKNRNTSYRSLILGQFKPFPNFVLLPFQGACSWGFERQKGLGTRRRDEMRCSLCSCHFSYKSCMNIAAEGLFISREVGALQWWLIPGRLRLHLHRAL